MSRRALLFGRANSAAAPVATVSDACLTYLGVACQSCRDACPESAIRFRPSRAIAQPEIDAARCSGCGECLAPCPTRALSINPEQRP